MIKRSKNFIVILMFVSMMLSVQMDLCAEGSNFSTRSSSDNMSHNERLGRRGSRGKKRAKPSKMYLYPIEDETSAVKIYNKIPYLHRESGKILVTTAVEIQDKYFSAIVVVNNRSNRDIVLSLNHIYLRNGMDVLIPTITPTMAAQNKYGHLNMNYKFPEIGPSGYRYTERTYYSPSVTTFSGDIYDYGGGMSSFSGTAYSYGGTKYTYGKYEPYYNPGEVIGTAIGGLIALAIIQDAKKGIATIFGESFLEGILPSGYTSGGKVYFPIPEVEYPFQLEVRVGGEKFNFDFTEPILELQNSPVIGVVLNSKEDKLLVEEVAPRRNSSTKEQGLAVGDEILQVDEVEVSNMVDFLRCTNSYNAGDVAVLKVMRDSKVQNVSVEILDVDKLQRSSQKKRSKKGQWIQGKRKRKAFNSRNEKKGNNRGMIQRDSEEVKPDTLEIQKEVESDVKADESTENIVSDANSRLESDVKHEEKTIEILSQENMQEVQDGAIIKKPSELKEEMKPNEAIKQNEGEAILERHEEAQEKEEVEVKSNSRAEERAKERINLMKGNRRRK